MSTLDKACEIARQAHYGQKDKAGKDYLPHPYRVMNRGKTDAEKICGILHDVVEDSDWTFEKLEAEGFSKEIIEALRCVTKTSENENYDDFINRIAKNPIAVQVKINDLLDNMDITRYRQISDDDLNRLNKYLKAYRRLIVAQIQHDNKPRRYYMFQDEFTVEDPYIGHNKWNSEEGMWSSVPSISTLHEEVDSNSLDKIEEDYKKELRLLDEEVIDYLSISIAQEKANHFYK